MPSRCPLYICRLFSLHIQRVRIARAEGFVQAMRSWYFLLSGSLLDGMRSCRCWRVRGRSILEGEEVAPGGYVG